MEFPERIYTTREVEEANRLLEKGYRHCLRVQGSSLFKQKVEEALALIGVAGYLDFLRMYIRRIEEIDGVTQLRQADASIWASMYAVENPVDLASVFIQKANAMREYLEGKLYYGGEAEKRSIEKRKEFLETLKKKAKEKEIAEECERLLNMWRESSMVY
jgi:hypothetical protein